MDPGQFADPQAANYAGLTVRKLFACLLLVPVILSAEAVPFASDGSLKMLYDNRMYPQAVESSGQVFVVWRGGKGLPWVRSYDLGSRRFGEARMLLEGVDAEIDAERFERDQHYAPVVWTDGDGRLHVAFGFHRTPGFHLASSRPSDITAWNSLDPISASISYPQVHRLAENRTLVYFRDGGHLGFWTYRVTGDGGRSWSAPPSAVIDMDAPPQGAPLASHAGSYQTTRVGDDGLTLHIAFIWKVEEPIGSDRYGGVLHDYTRRHNLYYVRTDLETGEVFNVEGKRLPRPVNFAVAQRECLVWDTEGASASVGPAIALDEDGSPSFLLPVSDATPYRSTFYFVHRRDGEWIRTPLAKTGHPFNSTHLESRADGSYRALLIAGDGEANEKGEMNRYGWGDRVEEWQSDTDGRTWRRTRDLTPQPGLRYQSVKSVRGQDGEPRTDLFLYYAWKGEEAGRAFLVDERP